MLPRYVLVFRFSIMKTMAAGSLLNLVHVQLVLPVVQLSCTVELLEVYEHYYVVLNLLPVLNLLFWTLTQGKFQIFNSNYV